MGLGAFHASKGSRVNTRSTMIREKSPAHALMIRSRMERDHEGAFGRTVCNLLATPQQQEHVG